MVLEELDSYFRALLPIQDVAGADSSLNGVQVGRPGLEVRRVAFAVDACQETFQRAAEAGAQMLFVHHGIFWGRVEPIVGTNFTRLKTLIDNDIALYAVHLPLDMHGEYGNNAQMAQALGLEELQPFALYHGTAIGWKGVLPHPMQLDEVIRKLFDGPQSLLGTLPFGPKEIRTVGIVSGGAQLEVDQAIEQGLDLYITGESSHTIYHRCLEAGINVIFGGHYQTEVWGVQAIARKLAADTSLETVFIDVPSGL